MEEPTRYPLAWPTGRPRTRARRGGSFSADRRPITVAVAMSRVSDEIDRIGGQYPLLSSNLRVRLDGRPILNEGTPSDPGVCLYFTLKGKPFALACDTYSGLAQNIAALAAHLDATRAIARYGVASAEETLQAFSALPPPSGGGQPAARPWRVVLGFRAGFPSDDITPTEARALIQGRWKAQAAALHPDRPGGDPAAMAELNAARDAGLSEIAG